MAEAIREFVPDPDTGTLKVIFTDAGSGLEIPLSELINFDVLAANGLGDLVPVDAGSVSSPPSTDESLGISPSVGQAVLPPRGTGTEHGPYGDGLGRTQSNNFGYLSKPGILSATKFAGPVGQVAGALGATGLLGPLGAVSTAGRLANGMINNNNALAASSARQSLGLNPSSAARIAKETYSDNQGRVADINANGQTYSVGLEAQTEDGRTTLTPEEGRRRSLGMAAVEATPKESKANAKAFDAEGFPSQKGFLGKIADQVLGRTPEPTSMASTPTPTLDAFNGSPVAPTSAVERSNLPSQPETKGISVRGSVASNLGVNMTGTGLLGQPTKSLPSFSELSATPTSAIPSVPASKLGSVNTGIIGSPTSLNQPTDPTPGLAGISSSFKAGKFGTIETMNKEHLDPSLNKALGAISEAVGPGVGVNSAYRDTAYNAKVNGKKQSQHLLGKAVDVNTVGWTPEQKAAALDAAAVSGVKGVGISKKGTMMHLDTRANPTTWGYSATTANDVPMGIDEAPGWAQDSLRAIEGAGVGLNPGPRFGPTPTSRVDALGTPLSATSQNIASVGALSNSIAPANVTNSGLGSIVNSNIDNLSVGALSNQGFAPKYTDKDINTMAVVAAGTLTPRTLQGVARQDPKAMAELNSVVSKMQNQAAEKGLNSIVDPSSLSSARSNFENFGGSLIDGVRNAVSGIAKSPTPDNVGARSFTGDFDATSVTGSSFLGAGQYNAPKTYADESPSSLVGANIDAAPAGMRNNNPGNLKYTGSSWQTANLPGLVGPSTNLDEGDPQAKFNSPMSGLASMARLAVGKFDEGMTTVASLISDTPKSWTPGKTFAAENVAKTMGIKPTDSINLRDPETLGGFMSALAQQEHGPMSKAYTKGMIGVAVADTLEAPGLTRFGEQKMDNLSAAQKSTIDKGLAKSLVNQSGINTGFNDRALDKSSFSKKSKAAQEQEARAKQAVANFSEYSGIARNEQKNDRKTTNVTGLASTGLGSSSKKSAPAAAPDSSKTESKKSETSQSSSYGGSSSNRGSGGSNANKSDAPAKTTAEAKPSSGAGAKGSASVSFGGSSSSSSSSTSGKGVGSKSSTSSKSKSSPAKGAEGARS